LVGNGSDSGGPTIQVMYLKSTWWTRDHRNEGGWLPSGSSTPVNLRP